MTTAEGNRTSLLGLFFGLVASATVAVLGVLGVLYFVDRVQHNIELNAWRATWPTVEGRVLSIRIPKHYQIETGDREYGYLQVKFAYEVEGQRYSGKQELPESPSSGWCGWSCEDEKIELELKYYAPGTPMTVRYDPSNPGESLIHPKGWPVGWLLLAIISGLAVPGAPITFFVRMRRGIQRPSSATDAA